MTPITKAVKHLLKPHYDNQGEAARLAMLYGKMPFRFLETKLRFEQMQTKVSKH